MKKKIFSLAFAFLTVLFLSITTLRAANVVTEVYPVSNNVVVLFNDVDNTFTLYIANEEKKEMSLFTDKRNESVKKINDFIFQMNYRKTYFVIEDDNKNRIACVVNGDDIFYISDIELYKAKKYIINKRIK